MPRRILARRRLRARRLRGINARVAGNAKGRVHRAMNHTMWIQTEEKQTGGIRTQGGRAAGPLARLHVPIHVVVRGMIELRRRTEQDGAATKQTRPGARGLRRRTAARQVLCPTGHQVGAGDQVRDQMGHDAARQPTTVDGPNRPKTLRTAADRGTAHRDKHDRDKRGRDRRARDKQGRGKRDRAATQRMRLHKEILRPMRKITTVKSQPQMHQRDRDGAGQQIIRTSPAASPQTPTTTTRPQIAGRMARRADSRERLAQMAR